MKKDSSKEIETKGNFKRGLVILVVGLVLLILCLWSMGVFNKNSDAIKFYGEYGNNTKITEDNLYNYSSKEEILDLLDHKTGVIYFGFPTCPWCQSMVVPLNEVAKDNKYDEIYYYNIRADRDTLK